MCLCWFQFCFPLWFISTLTHLWLEKILDMISSFLNLWRLVLRPSMWFTLENVSRAVEKNMNSAVLRWNALNKIKSIWSNVSFKGNNSLLLFYLDDKFINKSGVLISPNIIMLLSISPFMSINLLYVFRRSYVGCICIYKCYIFLLDLAFITNVLCCLLTQSLFLSAISIADIASFFFFFISFCMKYSFSSPHFQSCVSLDLKWASYREHIYRSCILIHLHTMSFDQNIYI